MPSGTPSSVAKNTADSVNSSVAGRRLKIRLVTGMLNTNERPKSPCSTRPRKAAYCSQSGRSKPYCAIVCARISCVTSGEIRTSIGLPIA